MERLYHRITGCWWCEEVRDLLLYTHTGTEALPRRATTVADRLGVDFALINRNRHKGDRPDAEGHMELLVGDVKNKVSLKNPFSAPRAESQSCSFRLPSSSMTW